MIQVPRITKDELWEVFRNKKVIIQGPWKNAGHVLESLQYMGVEVVAFWSDDIGSKMNLRKTKIPVLSTKETKKLSESNHLIVQSASFDGIANEELKGKVEKLGIEMSPLEMGSINLLCYPYISFDEAKDEEICEKWRDEYRSTNKKGMMKFFYEKRRAPIILCLPQKTADYTLKHTFDLANQEKMEFQINNKTYERLANVNRKLLKNRSAGAFAVGNKLLEPMDKIGNNINYKIVPHRPRWINKEMFEQRNTKLRIITAVREPISQNLSSMYQIFSLGIEYKDWILGDIENVTGVEKQKALDELQELFIENGSDAQKQFDAFIDRYVYTEKHAVLSRSIQQFYREFEKHVLDITKYDFDKEKGYGIIKEGNIEVFVYQLEKLNYIVPELSDWIGVPFDTLVNGNQASDKWIGESYKQAQKEIKITQEYFDKCFDEPYVKHCYSDEDIEKFKDKWRTHIEGEV